MNKFVCFCFALGMIGCGLSEKNDVQIEPGFYRTTVYDQRYTCTDGSMDNDNSDAVYMWEIVQSDEGQWFLYLTDNVFILCNPHGTGLLCVQTGEVTIPGICTYPMTMTFDLRYRIGGFIGDSETSYDLVTCTNGNSGTCSAISQLNGTLEY
jgi:hypothetical protein